MPLVDAGSAMLGFMQDYDYIQCPVNAGRALSLGTERRGLLNHTLPYSLAGWSRVVVWVCTTAEGLLVGVPIMARLWQEHVALAAAAAVEQANDHQR